MPRLTGTKCFSFILWLRFWNKRRRRRRRRRTWPLLFSSNLIFCLGTNMWRFIETVAPCDKRLLRGKAVFFCQSFSRQHQFRLPFVYLFYNFFFFFSICLLACVSPGNHCNNGNHRNILKANFNDACELLSRCLNTAGGKHNQQKDLGFIYATGGVPVVFLCEECSSVQVRKTTVFSSGDGE